MHTKVFQRLTFGKEVLFEAIASADLDVVAVGIADKGRRNNSVDSFLGVRHTDVPPGGNAKLFEPHSDLFNLGRVHGQGNVAHNQVFVSVHRRLALCAMTLRFITYVRTRVLHCCMHLKVFVDMR